MTKREKKHQHFCQLLAQSGLTQSALARKLGKSAVHVCGWNTGKYPIPDYTISWLKMYVAAKEIIKIVEE